MTQSTTPFAETIHDGADRPAADYGDLDTMGKTLLNILASIISTIAGRSFRKFLRKPEARAELRLTILDLARRDQDFRDALLAMVNSQPSVVEYVPVPHTHPLPRSHDSRFNWLLAALGGVVGAVVGFLFNLFLDATRITFDGRVVSDLVDHPLIQTLYYAIFIAVGFLLMGAIGRRQETGEHTATLSSVSHTHN